MNSIFQKIQQALSASRGVIVGVLAVLIFGVTIYGVYSLDAVQTFDWDESVYALKARGWTQGTPDESFYIYRPIGMPAAAAVGAYSGPDDLQSMRLFGVLFAGIAALAIFLLAARITSILIALTSSVVIVSSYYFLLQCASVAKRYRILQDCCVRCYGVFGLTMRAQAKNHMLYAAAVIAALAFICAMGLRYICGSSSLATAALYLSRYYSTGDDAQDPESVENTFPLNPSLKAFTVFCLLMVPHAIQSLLAFDRNPLGIILYAGDAANREYLGEGLLDYFLWIPTDLAGPLIGPLVIIGACGAGLFFVRSFDHAHARGVYWMMNIAFWSFFFTGLLTHAEGRYIIFPVIISVISGVWVFWVLGNHLHRVIGYGILALFCGYSLWMLGPEVARVNALFAVQEDYRQGIVIAGDTIREHTDTAPCAVWTTEEPQVSWHAACTAFTYDETLVLEYFNIYRDQHKYLTVFAGTDKEQPRIEQLRAQGVVLEPVITGSERVQVYQVFYAGDGGTDRLTHEEQGH